MVESFGLRQCLGLALAMVEIIRAAHRRLKAVHAGGV